MHGLALQTEKKFQCAAQLKCNKFIRFLSKKLCPFFSCALLVTSCCCLCHLSADDETSNVLKRSVKNVRSRFGSLLYIKIYKTLVGNSTSAMF